jgi:hypothetical protein
MSVFLLQSNTRCYICLAVLWDSITHAIPIRSKETIASSWTFRFDCERLVDVEVYRYIPPKGHLPITCVHRSADESLVLFKRRFRNRLTLRGCSTVQVKDHQEALRLAAD